MKALKITCIKWENASRDKRELGVLKELGVDVFVMAKGENSDKGRCVDIDGFNVYLYSARPLGDAKILRPVNKIMTFWAWSLYAARINADIISGCDIPGLLIGYLSNIGKGKNKKAVLVYDSHEFEIGRAGKRCILHTWIIARLEKFLMKRCAFSIMVNDSIADEVQRIHKLRRRPIVVRSTPDCWEIDETECRKTRQFFQLSFMNQGK